MEAVQKSKRVRKKRLFCLILHQVEFYFSNASLTRDVFLRDLLSKHKFVPLSILLGFNKIKELTDEEGDVRRALENSHFLQLSPDGTGVGRRSPFVLKEDAERCTVYVENIPRGCGSPALRRTFSAFGTIDYISVPVNRATGQHRGFGFVEFRTPNMAHNVLQAFGSLGRRMPSEHYPEYLVSPGTRSLERAAAAGSDPETDEFADSYRHQQPTPAADSRPGKRKLSTDSSSRDTALKITRFAITPESSLPTAGSATPANTDNSNLSQLRLDGAVRAMECSDDTEKAVESQRRRRRTRRGRKQCVTETEDTALLALQIMPLSEWSRCRERYRCLQKEHMTAVKLLLRTEVGTKQPAKQPARRASVEFAAGTVVRFTPESAATDPSQLIPQLKRQYGAIYVELPSAPGAAYMRFPSSETASAAVGSGLTDAVLLQGDEERMYWSRLAAERQLTRAQHRRSKERGRHKLLRRLKAAFSDSPLPNNPEACCGKTEDDGC